jgi:competence protein ComFB
VEQVILRNYMETCVEDVYNRVADNLNVCKCDRCRLDVMAITLNALPSRYIVTGKGELFAKTDKMDGQFDISIVSELTKAAAKIRENPNH